MAAVVFNELMTKMQCPDCADWIDLPVEILGLHLKLNMKQFEAEVRRHVAPTPMAHPTFVPSARR